ncbi:DUF6584 family protein [Bacillus sp. 7884-1]|uniref:DUF6584 family protein n=1 Tax=Bacillus sp. 7884-1 TaxID=2021693 RepID=UPI000BA687BB|nr:DUF6584 family protein [Bacillus sp. 7884-1]PAE42785.1 DNA helicase [Bacillus sp. 7884-1]
MEKIPVKTLKKIEDDINKNDLGKARDRLHGLISAYPNELELRKRLGDIYFELKYPSMAGRYWYLEENKTPEMEKACGEFEKSMGNDPFRIARTLKYKGDKEILIRLELDWEVSPLKNKVKEKLIQEPEKSLQDKLVAFGCISIFIIIVMFEIIGVYEFINWIFE